MTVDPLSVSTTAVAAAAATTTVASNKNDWPQVPQVPDMSNLHCAQFNSNNISTAQNASIEDLGYKMDQILGNIFDQIHSTDIHFMFSHIFLEFMQTQSCQISELRSVVDYVELQKVAGKKDEGVDMRTMAKNIEFNMSKLIEEYMNRFEREHTKRLDQFLAARLVSNGRGRKFRFL